MKILNIYILTGLFLFSTLIAVSQEKNILNKESFGFNIGLPVVSESLSEDVYYNPILIMGYYNIPLMQTNTKHNFSVGIEPQINPVFLDNNLNDLEFGCNVGLYYLHLIGQKSIWYAGIGSGPHFITVNAAMQATGFIFSDNFMTGTRIFLTGKNEKPLYLNLQFRFRHISNANLSEPNIGIDGFFAVFGIVKEI